MRTSAGFFVTGLCGNTRIQGLPLRFRWREMVGRAASICWPGMGARVRDCRANSPKARALARLAFPERVPFCDLRYLVRAGARAMVEVASAFSGQRSAGRLGAVGFWVR